MSENQRRILEMLKEGKITVEEAERLLALTGSETGKGGTLAGAATGEKRSAKYLRVVVQPDSEAGAGAERVNIRVPVSLIRAGMKLTSLVPSHAADKVNEALKEHGVNFDLRNIKDGDIEELITALGDLEVDIEGDRGEKVKVFAE